MAKRKVLIVVHQLNYGGVQISLLPALNAINYEENDVTLYVRKDRLDLLDKINKNVSNIIVNHDSTRYYRKPYTAFLTAVSSIQKLFGKDTAKTEQKIVDYIVKKQFEYEYDHYFKNIEAFDIAVSYIQDYTAQFVAEYVKAKRKVVFWHTSTDDHHDLHKRIFDSFDRIVCVSKGALCALSSFHPVFSEKMICIENHIDAAKVRENSTAYNVSLPKDKFILCTCGRITKVKGFDLAVKAAEILRDKNINFVWYFVGDGAERDNIEKMIAERGLENNIVITGLLDNPFPYVKGCDIYVQPSYEEAYPLSLIEAQILCRPIVTTATVGGKSVVIDGKTGTISEIDSQSVADKIYELAHDDPLKKKFSANLEKIDYEADRVRFCSQWAKLLGE